MCLNEGLKETLRLETDRRLLYETQRCYGEFGTSTRKRAQGNLMDVWLMDSSIYQQDEIAMKYCK